MCIRDRNKWERMSWDEAIDYVADRFIEIRDKYGAETIIFGQGTGRDIASWITRLAWSYGSPNYTCFALSGLACYLPRVAGMAATSGGYTVADCSQQFPDRYDNPNWRCPELMVLWGNYPLRANSDGFYGHWMIDLMKRGMKIMMVDPRVTWLSLKAEEHLRLRPGTDAALALGMMNVIINEDLYDHDFVEKWCYGFDELTGRVQEYPPAKVAEITWVPEDQIVRAARLLATSKPAAMQWGLAVDMVKEALPAGQAIVGLFQITGNVDVPGGNIFPCLLYTSCAEAPGSAARRCRESICPEGSAGCSWRSKGARRCTSKTRWPSRRTPSRSSPEAPTTASTGSPGRCR